MGEYRGGGGGGGGGGGEGGPDPSDETFWIHACYIASIFGWKNIDWIRVNLYMFFHSFTRRTGPLASITPKCYPK